MCKFKNCEGPHACFLRDISPCPRSRATEVTKTTAPRQYGHLRVVSRGFLDQDELNRALGMEAETVPEEPRKNIGRVSSKLMRAVEVLGLREAS